MLTYFKINFLFIYIFYIFRNLSFLLFLRESFKRCRISIIDAEKRRILTKYSYKVCSLAKGSYHVGRMMTSEKTFAFSNLILNLLTGTALLFVFSSRD